MKRIILFILLMLSLYDTSFVYANSTEKIKADSIAAKSDEEKPAWYKYIPTLKGTIRARYEWSPEIGASRFQLRNARVGILGDVTDNINYKAEIDLCDQGTILVADAYARIRFFEKQFGISAGYMRLPISLDANRGPSSYYFANRSFLGKYVGNVRDVGVKFGYHAKQLPLNIEAGIFNGAESQVTKDQWNKTFIYVARANYIIQGLKAEVSFLSQRPDIVRMNSFDFALSWNYRNFFLEGEYINTHYTNDQFKTVHAYNIMSHYRIPFNKVLTHMLIQARWDSMTDYWDGLYLTNSETGIVFKDIKSGRERLTIGLTLAYLKKFGAEFRINYEKYFYHKDAIITDAERDKLVAEFIVKF